MKTSFSDTTTPSRRSARSSAPRLAKAFDASVVVVSVAPVLAPAGRGIGPIDPADPPDCIARSSTTRRRYWTNWHRGDYQVGSAIRPT